MKHSIISRWSNTPIKNIPTPINRFNGGDEDEDYEPITAREEREEISESGAVMLHMISEVRFLLIVLIVLKVICLLIKR